MKKKLCSVGMQCVMEGTARLFIDVTELLDVQPWSLRSKGFRKLTLSKPASMTAGLDSLVAMAGVTVLQGKIISY